MAELLLSDLTIPETHKYVINHVLRKIIGNAYIDSIFLFGSRARGVASQDSDIDLFIVTNGEIRDDNHKAFDVLYGATEDCDLDLKEEYAEF